MARSSRGLGRAQEGSSHESWCGLHHIRTSTLPSKESLANETQQKIVELDGGKLLRKSEDAANALINAAELLTSLGYETLAQDYLREAHSVILAINEIRDKIQLKTQMQRSATELT